jgi:hypothetical protein
MPFTNTFNSIVMINLILLLFIARLHGQLIEIGKKSIVLNQYLTIVSYCDSDLIVTINLILLDLWEAGSRANNTTSLILVNLVIWNMVAAIEHNDAVTVIINVVVLNPCKTCFYTENALRSRLVDEVIQNHSVCRVETTKCYVGLVVLVDVILLNISTRSIYNKNTLTIIAENLVV